MSSQGVPRKFSEKIAIMERKQNEDEEAFTSVMRDIRAITSANCSLENNLSVLSQPLALPTPQIHCDYPSNSSPTAYQCKQYSPYGIDGQHEQEQIHQPLQHHHQQQQLVDYCQCNSQLNNMCSSMATTMVSPLTTPTPPQSVAVTTSSSTSPLHYHPYRAVKASDHQRLPHCYYRFLPHQVRNSLELPNSLSSTKALSDSTIISNVYNSMQPYHFTCQPINFEEFHRNGERSEHFAPRYQYFHHQQEHEHNLHLSPVLNQSINTCYLLSDKKGTRDMLSMNSLPNIPNACDSQFIAAIQHGNEAMLKTPSLPIEESQSAPTSPLQNSSMPIPLYSNTSSSSLPLSPNYGSYSNEVLDIPNIILTNTDGQLDLLKDLDINELQQFFS